jgi:hypothetical protein
LSVRLRYQDPIRHVAAHTMSNPKPSTDSGLLTGHVHLLLVPVPNALVKIKIKPFRYIDSVSGYTLDARPLIVTSRQYGLNLRDVNQTIIPQSRWDLVGSHSGFPFRLDFTNLGFCSMILGNTATLFSRPQLDVRSAYDFKDVRVLTGLGLFTCNVTYQRVRNSAVINELL